MNHIVLFFISLVFLFLHPFSLQAEIVDRCIAVVNDDIITFSEVNETGRPIFKRVAEETPPGQLEEILQQARTSVIQKMIEKKIILQEAKKYNITVSTEEVDVALQRILASNDTSMEQFREQMVTMGMDENQYKEDLRGQILSSKLVNIVIRSKVIIPEEKIIDYYDVHYTEQVADGGYYLLQIGATWETKSDSDDLGVVKEKTKNKIKRVRNLATSGNDFRELARQYSDLPSAVDGGDIGTFKEGEMASAMRKAVTGLQAGQISEIVELPSSYQIFKLLSSQEGQIITKVSYESVKEEIRETLYKQEIQSLYQNSIKDMRNQAYIKIL
jgi:peptidyl-prolyl cis-trans isomerase SurA